LYQQQYRREYENGEGWDGVPYVAVPVPAFSMALDEVKVLDLLR